VSLERGQLCLVSTTDKLLGRKRSGSGLENLKYGHRCRSRVTLFPQKLALTWLTSGGHWVSIVRSRTQATEFFFFFSLSSTLLNTRLVTHLVRKDIPVIVVRGGKLFARLR
jgi:hypothetical protein